MKVVETDSTFYIPILVKKELNIRKIDVLDCSQVIRIVILFMKKYCEGK